MASAAAYQKTTSAESGRIFMAAPYSRSAPGMSFFSTARSPAFM